jgi:hypothetical protein
MDGRPSPSWYPTAHDRNGRYLRQPRSSSRARRAGGRHNGRLVTSGSAVIEETFWRSRGSRCADRLEFRLTALRLRLLAVPRFGTFRHRPEHQAFLGEPPVVRLEAGKRECMLWHVHDAARIAHREWERGAEPSEAMRDLSVALARVAEYDV